MMKNNFTKHLTTSKTEVSLCHNTAIKTNTHAGGEKMTLYFKLSETAAIPVTILDDGFYTTVNSSLRKVDIKDRDGIPYYERGDMTCLSAAMPGNTVHALNKTITEADVLGFWKWFDEDVAIYRTAYKVSYHTALGGYSTTVFGTKHKTFITYNQALMFVKRLAQENTTSVEAAFETFEKYEGRSATESESMEITDRAILHHHISIEPCVELAPFKTKTL